MTQQHARISRGNLPVPLKLQNIIIRLPLWIGLKKGDSFEHWLVMYFLKYWFRIIFDQKKLWIADLTSNKAFLFILLNFDVMCNKMFSSVFRFD